MLAPDQQREFEERGLVRIRGAFPTDAAMAMEDQIWNALGKRFGVSPNDPATWQLPLGLKLQGLKPHRVFHPIGSEATLGALDDLLSEGWAKPPNWGQFLVTFPGDTTQPWTVPYRVWHTDFGYGSPPEPLFGALVFSFQSEVPPRRGATLVVAGSHRVVRNFLAKRRDMTRVKMKVARKVLLQSDPWLKALSSEEDDSDRVERFMRKKSTVGDVPVRVVELTGEPGDVVLAHPWMLHAGSPNCGNRPRFMRVQRIRARFSA